jgi:hypothetical protein
MSYIEYVVGDCEAQDPLPELARTNDFTMADLEDNRKGKISNKQMTKLFGRALRPIRYPAMALLGWLICCFIVKTLVPGIVLTVAAVLGFKTIGLLFGAVTLACLGALFVAMLRSFRYVALLVQDLSAGKAVSVDGRASVSREESRGLGLDQFHGEQRMQCWYVVQERYFEVSEEAGAALPHGTRFRIYFAPKSQLLLSIEPAPAGPPAFVTRKPSL